MLVVAQLNLRGNALGKTVGLVNATDLEVTHYWLLQMLR